MNFHVGVVPTLHKHRKTNDSVRSIISPKYTYLALMSRLESTHPKKILVIRFSSIGDIVLCSPVFRLLKKHWNAEIHWLTKPQYSFVNEHNPYIDRIITLDDSFEQSLEKIQQTNYDLVVDLHKNLRSWRFKRALKSPAITFDKRNMEKWVLVNFHMNWMKEPVHLVDRYLQALQPLGIEDDGEGLDYFYGENLENPIPMKDYIAYGIGGTYHTKKMPATQIIRHFANLPLPLVLLGGKTEESDAQIIKDAIGDRCINMVNRCDLHTTGKILDDAEYVISHDTATLHMAAAFRKKILSIWGATAPELGMTPYLPKQFSQNSVLLEKENLACHPCSKLGNTKCPKGHFKCMTELDEEYVQEKINQLLSIPQHPTTT